MAPLSLEMMAAVAGGSEPSRRARPRRESVARLISALALAVPTAGAFVAGQPYVAVYVAMIAAVLAWEWAHVCGGARFGAAALAQMALASGAAILSAFQHHAWALAAIGLGFPLLWLVAAASGIARAHWIAIGTFYVGLPSIALIWLYDLGEAGKLLVIWLIIVVAATDIGAYFVGRAIGGPKLAPRVSPGKTWSGLAGGTICAALAGLATALAMGFRDPAVALLCAAILAPISQAGDLFESRVKRIFGIKDASGIIPGHGGMMDRVDGLVAAILAVAAAVYARGGDPRSWL